jgi:hypothetical protein
MVPSGMLRRVALVSTDVSEKRSASFIRVTKISKLGTTLAVTINRPTLRRYTKLFLRSVRRLLVRASVVPSLPILITLMKEALSSSETSVLTRATRHNIHCHRREYLKSYTFLLKMSEHIPSRVCYTIRLFIHSHYMGLCYKCGVTLLLCMCSDVFSDADFATVESNCEFVFRITDPICAATVVSKLKIIIQLISH